MSNLRITNVSGETLWFRDLYTEIRPGESVAITRTPAEIADMIGLQEQLALGTVTVEIVFAPFELPNDLVSIWPLGKNWRPSVPNAAALPISPDNRLSDVRLTADTLLFYVWDGGSWIATGSGGGPPTGPAGGSLSGSYPNPTIAAGAVGTSQLTNSGVTAGTYGSIDNVPVITVDSKGRVTSVTVESTLLQLIKFISEGPAKGFVTGATKTVTGTVFPTQILWRRADATKLVEKNLTYTGVLPTTIEWILYAADGTTVLETALDTIAYTGMFETGRVRAIT